MFARVETFHAEPSGMDDLVSELQHTIGLVRTLPGNMGGYTLVNRDSGSVLGITFWQSEEDRGVAESEFEAAAHHGDVGLYGVAMQEALGRT
jgi:heme-degrading monooxygenase HmoA